MAASIAFGVALRNLWRASQSRSWPTVDGTIVEARVVVGHKGSRPKIVYRYHIAGQDHESTRVVIGGLWETSGDGPARMVRQFPIGSSAAVAIDPRNPRYSVLIPGVRIHQVLTVFFGAVIFIAALSVSWVLVFVAAPM